MSQSNSGWVRRRTAVLLTAALAAAPMLPVTAYATGTDGSPSGDSSSQPAEQGVASIDGTPYESLELALAAAQKGQTVTLNQNVEVAAQLSIPEGVTLDGAGHTLTCTAAIANGGVIDVTSNDVTIKDLVVNAGGNAKHGIQFYCATGGVVEGCTVNGGRYTSVVVNGAEVSIKGTTLNPDEGAYAHVEYGMGSGVTSIPSVALEDVTAGSSAAPLVYVDAATMERVAQNSDPQIDASDTSAIVEAINKNLTGTQIYAGENGGATSEKPAGPDPDPQPPAADPEPVTVSEATGGSVSVSAESAAKGEKVTITLTPEQGKVVGSIKVVDAEGNEVELTKGQSDNEYTFEMPASAVTVSATFVCDGGESCPSHGFADVDPSSWYHLAVDWAVQTGAMHGYAGSDDFGPDDTLTRAQMAAVLYNKAGSPEVEAGELRPDCLAGSWYVSPVTWALEKGVFHGYDDGTGNFGPNDSLTRAQMAAVLHNMANSPEADLSGLLADCDEGAWYADAVAWALEQGVFHGYADGSGNFGPDDSLTREQAAIVLMNAAELAGEDVSQRADLSDYPDAGDVSSYARDAMEWAVERGLISGVETEDGERVLDPQGTCTRAQLAALLMNASEQSGE